MTEKSKRIWKIVGISAGALLIIGGTIAFFVWRKRNEEDPSDENPYVNQKPSSTATSNSPKTTGSATSYTKEEIKQMQAWMMTKASFTLNAVVFGAINETGGIDGIIGDGFNRALNEAIKQGWVAGMSELYKKAMAKDFSNT